eukprot:g4775.t1
MKLTYFESSRNRKIAKFVFGNTNRRYSPTVWLVTGVLQTIMTTLLRIPKLKLVRENLHLKSMERKSTCAPRIIPKGLVSVDWVESMKSSQKDAVIVVVPGLTGSSQSGYIRRLAEHLVNTLNVRVAMYNPRGRGGNSLVTPFMYSAGYTSDLRRTIQHIKRNTSLPIFCVGYSLGSNVLAKYLGEEGESCVVKGAVCLATPVDLISMSNHLRFTWQGMFMDRVLVRFVKRVVNEFQDKIRTRGDIDLDAIDTSVSTMSRFDRFAIAPQMGLTCSSEYYRVASSGLWLSRIRTPTLFVHARNDPICPGDLIRTDDFKANSYLFSCITQKGGHSMDWPSGILCEKSWSAGVVERFIKFFLFVDGGDGGGVVAC